VRQHYAWSSEVDEVSSFDPLVRSGRGQADPLHLCFCAGGAELGITCEPAVGGLLLAGA
jgi:hypothetical protein